MADNELIIKIGASSKQFQDELDKVKKQTEDLSGQLDGLAKVSAGIFTALVVEAGLAVHAFGESEKSSNALTQSLQQQGIFSQDLADNYKAQAAALQDLTGVDDDTIIKGQALLQGYLGQTKITKELTAAVVDLSVAQGIDLNSAFELVGKSIGSNVNALQRQGIEIDTNLTKQEKIGAVIKGVSEKFGGQAEAANQGIGSLKGLTSAFSDFQEEIGSRFAPIVTVIIAAMTDFFKLLKENKALLDFITSLGVAAGVVTGLVTALSAASIAFVAFRAAALAAGVATEATSLAVKGLVGATGLGLLILLVTELYLNWGTVFPRMEAIFQAFVDTVTTLGGDLSKILNGVFTLNLDTLKEGLAQAKATIQKGFADATKDIKPIAIETAAQDPKKAAAASKAEAERKAQANRTIAAQKAERAAIVAEVSGQSDDVVNLKKKEADILKKIEDKKNKDIRALLEKDLQDTKALREDAEAEELSKRNTFNTEILKNNQQYNALSASDQKLFLLKNQKELQNSILTKQDLEEQDAKESIQKQISTQNELLQNQKRFGKFIGSVATVINFQAVLEFANIGLNAINQLAEAPKALKTNIDDTIKAEDDLKDKRTQEVNDALAADEKKLKNALDLGQISQDTYDESLQALQKDRDAKLKAISDATDADKKRITDEAAAKDAASEQEIKNNAAATGLISQSIGKIVEELVPGLGGFASALIDLAAKGKDAIAGAVNGLLSGLKNVTVTILSNIGTILEGIAQLIGPFLTEIISHLGDLLGNLISSLGEIIPTLISGLIDAVISFFDNFDTLIDKIIDGLINAIISIAEKAPDIVQKIIEHLPEITIKLAEAMPEIAIKLATAIIEHLPEIITTLVVGLTRGILNGLIEGFEDVINGFVHILNHLPFVNISDVHLHRYAEGGLVPQGGLNQDSIPVLTSPGELIVPTKNFNEVVNSVVAQRTGTGALNGSAPQNQSIKVMIGFDGREAERVLTARQVEARALGVTQEATA